MHARRKGKSGSTRPLGTVSPEWIDVTLKDIEKNVVEMARSGIPQSKIGGVLRDQYGIPNVKLVTGKKLSQILKENDLSSPIPEDLQNLLNKAENLKKHLSRNKKDLHNRRGLQLVESKIHRISKYYKGEGVLDKEWRYTKSDI